MVIYMCMSQIELLILINKLVVDYMNDGFTTIR